jgi:hypothetical protein
MKEDYLIISDFDEFINASRRLVFKCFGEKQIDESDLFTELNEIDQEELDSNLSYDESAIIAKDILIKQKHKVSGDTRYLVTDEKYMVILEELNTRLASNLLNSLVNKGLVESAYDDESNDFVFWIKNDNKDEQKEKPETD